MDKKMTDEEFDKARKENYQPNCKWYVDEDENGNYVRCKKENGFCLIQNFFTACIGKCEDFLDDE